MATVYEKIVGDKTVILDPREAAIRIPLASANQWTELRIAVALSLTSTSASNAAYPSESFVASTVYDRHAFGLKNSDTDDLPGVAGTSFWGVITPNGIANTLTHTTGVFVSDTAPQTRFGVLDGVTVIDSEVDNSGDNSYFPNSTETQAATLFAAFWGMRIVITNRGAATQTVQFAFSDDSHNNKTDCSETALRTFLTALPGFSTLCPAMTANSGGVALDVPDAFFFRFPMLSSRVRLHNVMVMQAVP